MTEKALKGLHSSIDLVFKDPARKDYALKALAVHGRALQFLAPQLRADKEVVLKAVGSDGWALQWADKECRKDKELVTKAMSQDVGSLQFAPQELLADRDFALELVQINGSAYEYLAPELKLDRQVARAAVAQDGYVLALLPEELRKDRDLVHKAVQQKGQALEFAPDFWNDQMLVTAAVKNDPAAFQWASQELQSDRELWLQVCPERLFYWKDAAAVQRELDREPCLLSLATAVLARDAELVVEAGCRDPNALPRLERSAWEGEEVLLRMARRDLRVLRHLKWSREVAFKALEISGMALEFVPEELREDRDIVHFAVQRQGLALRFAPLRLRGDREVVLSALRQDRTALLFASAELRRDKAVWLYDGAPVPSFEPPAPAAPPEAEAEA